MCRCDKTKSTGQGKRDKSVFLSAKFPSGDHNTWYHIGFLDQENSFAYAFFSRSRCSFLRWLIFANSPEMRASSGTSLLAEIRSSSCWSSFFSIPWAIPRRYNALADDSRKRRSGRVVTYSMLKITLTFIRGTQIQGVQRSSRIGNSSESVATGWRVRADSS